MPNETQHYHLIKPTPEDYYDIADQNTNMDAVDAALKAHDDSLANKADLVDGKLDPSQMGAAGIPIITTTGTYSAYLANVEGVKKLEVGMMLIIIPHVDSVTNPTLNVNGLGAKPLNRSCSSRTNVNAMGAESAWISMLHPILIQYDGARWKVVGHPQPVATDLYGVVPTSAGGLGRFDWVDNQLIFPYSGGKAFMQVPAPKVTNSVLIHSPSSSPYWCPPVQLLPLIGVAPATHVADKTNPHGVTAAQAGARPSTWLPTAAEVGAAPSSHATSRANPHGVTAAQVGAVTSANPVFTGSISMGRKAGTVVGIASCAIGDSTEASQHLSHAEGLSTVASGMGSYASGYYTVADGYYARTYGFHTIASSDYCIAIGRGNVATPASTFIIGGGQASSRYNIFRVNNDGNVFASGSYLTSGADYAELFEWMDGNVENADRRGLFVTMDGEMVRIANATDTYILGIVSAFPGVVGNQYADQWKGMYLTDIFGAPLTQIVEHEATTETIEEHVIERPAHTTVERIVNPDYVQDGNYISRSDRPEWGTIGLMGQLVVIDDGTCIVNKWAKVADGGTATMSDTQTKYRVMARLDETHIKVLML